RSPGTVPHAPAGRASSGKCTGAGEKNQRRLADTVGPGSDKRTGTAQTAREGVRPQYFSQAPLWSRASRVITASALSPSHFLPGPLPRSLVALPIDSVGPLPICRPFSLNSLYLITSSRSLM